jgi:hypothetical protein
MISLWASLIITACFVIDFQMKLWHLVFANLKVDPGFSVFAWSRGINAEFVISVHCLSCFILANLVNLYCLQSIFYVKL